MWVGCVSATYAALHCQPSRQRNAMRAHRPIDCLLIPPPPFLCRQTQQLALHRVPWSLPLRCRCEVYSGSCALWSPCLHALRQCELSSLPCIVCPALRCRCEVYSGSCALWSPCLHALRQCVPCSALHQRARLARDDHRYTPQPGTVCFMNVLNAAWPVQRDRSREA